MSEDLLNLVLQKIKQNLIRHGKNINKIRKLTSFGSIFQIMSKFDSILSRTIDSTLGLCSKMYGYQYSEIIRSLSCGKGFCLLRLHHKDSLRKRVVLERYPQPQISKILQVADFRYLRK